MIRHCCIRRSDRSPSIQDFIHRFEIDQCVQDVVVVRACVAVQHDQNNHQSPDAMILRDLPELRPDEYVAVSTHGTEDFGPGRPCEGIADRVCPLVAAVPVSKPIQLSSVPGSSVFPNSNLGAIPARHISGE